MQLYKCDILYVTYNNYNGYSLHQIEIKDSYPVNNIRYPSNIMFFVAHPGPA